MIHDLIRKSRSFRRFDESVRLSRRDLEDLVELARCSPSAANLQPLKFFLVWEEAVTERVFPCLRWAAYLEDWDGPDEGERPAAYIVILHDRDVHPDAGVDPGIAVQSILLGAVEKGWGGCILASISRDRLREFLELPAHLDILLVVALGKPGETVVLEECLDGNVRYWRDAESVHHVPKRPMNDLIVNEPGP